MKKGFKRKMNLDDSDDEYEAGTGDDDEDDDEDGAKKKPNALVVSRWKMILPKRGEVGKHNMFFFSSNLQNSCNLNSCFFLRCQKQG